MAERGTRLSESWIPTDKDIAYAESLGMSQEQVALEAEKFRNYWLSLTGQRATKLDWHRTWRNWVLKDYAKGDAFRAWQSANPPAVYNGQSLETIAEIARKPWGRCRYPRDVLEQCVVARMLTKDEMEAALQCTSARASIRISWSGVAAAAFARLCAATQISQATQSKFFRN